MFNEMNNQLEKLMKSKKPVAVYSDTEDCEKFAVGYIVALQNGVMLMKHIGIDGKYDGMSVSSVDDIYRIEYDSEYISLLNAAALDNFGDKLDIDTDEDLLEGFLNAAVNKKCLVEVSLNELWNVVVGYVERTDGDMVYMQQVNERGQKDGHTVFFSMNIRRAMLGGEELRELAKQRA